MLFKNLQRNLIKVNGSVKEFKLVFYLYDMNTI